MKYFSVAVVIVFRQGQYQCGVWEGQCSPVRHTWPTHQDKISNFIGKNLLQLEFSTVSLIFAVIFWWTNLDSPQNKGNYLSSALCNWLGIKVFKMFLMSHELSQLLDHFMFSIERKKGLQEATWGSWISISVGARDNLL